MAQRQFRTDDTSVWGERFGAGTDGPLTIAGNATDSTANTTITGTVSTNSATVGSGTGFSDGNLILIHQTQGTGSGAWELNKILSIGGGTNWTLNQELTNTYGTGAQVYLLKQYSSVTLNSGVTFSATSWNGTKGGILAFLCSGTITIDGTFSLDGVGFRGGAAGNNGINQNPQGAQGESVFGTGVNTFGAGNYNPNGNGGGGGSNGSSPQNAGAGGGGANAASGTGGTNVSGSTAGAGGTAVGTSSLVNMHFGGGGGGGQGNNNDGGNGGRGGGIGLFIGRTIGGANSIVCRGTNGGGTEGGGGGGAGGSILLKGQIVSLPVNTIAPAGTGGATRGGAGSVGRIHVDYSQILSGSANPTATTSLDTVFNEIPVENSYTLLL